MKQHPIMLSTRKMNPINKANFLTKQSNTILSGTRLENENNKEVIFKEITTPIKLVFNSINLSTTSKHLVLSQEHLHNIKIMEELHKPLQKSQICRREDFSQEILTKSGKSEETSFVERIFSYSESANQSTNERQANNCPLNPESKKKSELCSYLKLMDRKRKEHVNGNLMQNRRSKRVKNLRGRSKSTNSNGNSSDSNSVIMKECTVKSDSEINNAIINENKYLSIDAIPKSFKQEKDFDDCIMDIVREIQREKAKKKHDMDRRLKLKRNLQKNLMNKTKITFAKTRRLLRSSKRRLRSNFIIELRKESIKHRKYKFLKENKRKKEKSIRADRIIIAETNPTVSEPVTPPTIKLEKPITEEQSSVSGKIDVIEIRSTYFHNALHEHNYTKSPIAPSSELNSTSSEVMKSMTILNERIGQLIKNKIKFPLTEHEKQKMKTIKFRKFLKPLGQTTSEITEEEITSIKIVANGSKGIAINNSNLDEDLSKKTDKLETKNDAKDVIVQEVVEEKDKNENSLTLTSRESEKDASEPEKTTPIKKPVVVNGSYFTDISKLLEKDKYQVPVITPVQTRTKRSLRSCLVKPKRRKNGATDYELLSNNDEEEHTLRIEDDKGDVISAYYFDYNLVVAQTKLVTFWMQSPLGFVLEAQNLWIPKGSVARLNIGGGCVMKASTTSFVSTEQSVAYVELWTKEHKSDFRERPVTDIFIVVYFCKNQRDPPEKKLLQIENISGYADDVKYVVLRNTGHIIVSWMLLKKDTASPVIRCYHLAADFQSIISVKEMETFKHKIDSLHQIEDCDKLFLGYGEGKITLWNLEFGYRIATIELTSHQPEPKLIWVKCDRGYLLALQQHFDGFFSLLAINGLNYSWKRLRLYKPPDECKLFHGICLEDGILISFYENCIVCWDVKNGNILAADERGNEHYFTSGKHIIISANNHIVVRAALSFLITNYDLNEIDS